MELRIVFRCTCEGWKADHEEFDNLNDALAHLEAEATAGDIARPHRITAVMRVASWNPPSLNSSLR